MSPSVILLMWPLRTASQRFPRFPRTEERGRSFEDGVAREVPHAADQTRVVFPVWVEHGHGVGKALHALDQLAHFGYALDALQLVGLLPLAEPDGLECIECIERLALRAAGRAGRSVNVSATALFVQKRMKRVPR